MSERPAPARQAHPGVPVGVGRDRTVAQPRDRAGFTTVFGRDLVGELPTSSTGPTWS